MNESPINVIGTAEVARRANLSIRQVQRIAAGLPGRLPPHASPGRGTWFEEAKVSRWIEKNRLPSPSNRAGRKRRNTAGWPGGQWRDATQAVSLEPYELFRSARRQGCGEFVKNLTRLADIIEHLPSLVESRACRVRFQDEYDAISNQLHRIDLAAQGRFRMIFTVAVSKVSPNTPARSRQKPSAY